MSSPAKNASSSGARPRWSSRGSAMAMNCAAHADVSWPHVPRRAKPDHCSSVATTGAAWPTSAARRARRSAFASGTVEIDASAARGSPATITPRTSCSAARSNAVDRPNANETLSSAMSGTQRDCRYGAMARADDHPNRSANDAAIVRRSVVLATSPMRSSKAWSGPARASRRSVPSIQPDSGVVIGSLAAHPNDMRRRPARADREPCRTSRTRSNRRASGEAASGRRCTRRSTRRRRSASAPREPHRSAGT